MSGAILPNGAPAETVTGETEEDIWDKLADAYASGAIKDETIDEDWRQCPLFMDEEDLAKAEETGNNSAFTTLKSIEVDDTPDVAAEKLKDKGNKLLLIEGGKSVPLAIDCYTEALSIEGVPAPLRAILFSNRAQGNLMIHNYGKVVQDAMQSIKINPTAKAYFRAMRASNAVGKHERTLEFFEEAQKTLQNVPPAEMTLINKQRDEAQKAVAKKKEQEAERARLEIERTAPQRAVLQGLVQRGIRVGRGEIDGEQLNAYTQGDLLAVVDNTNGVNLPALFVYDQFHQSDFVRQLNETDSLFDHFDIMFPPNTEPAVWDVSQEYTRDNLTAFYHYDRNRIVQIPALQAKTVPQKKNDEGPVDGYFEIDVKQPLSKSLLAHPQFYVQVPGFFVVIHVTPKNSQFAKEWRGN